MPFAEFYLYPGKCRWVIAATGHAVATERDRRFLKRNSKLVGFREITQRSGSGTATNASPARTTSGSGTSTQPPAPTVAVAKALSSSRFLVQMKAVKHAVEDGREQDGGHDQYGEAAVERVKPREELASRRLGWIERSHPR
jgi:hypothetical protein